MASAGALAINQGIIIYSSRLSRSAERSKRYFHGRGRSRERHLQRLLPAEAAALRGSGLALSGANAPALPKGEPLAKPEALHLNREVYRHAKGPIPEGAVAVGDWGS